ncbi:MAG: hypothetical protein HWN68_02220 [Desulfobacterales bacterium]|nr:hypothetical protein [Desulfobacterales bacterium]
MTRKGYGFERRVRKMLERCDWTVVRPQIGSADLIAMRNGITWLIKCKGGNKGITEGEKRKLLEWAGGHKHMIPVLAVRGHTKAMMEKVFFRNLRTGRTLRMKLRVSGDQLLEISEGNRRRILVRLKKELSRLQKRYRLGLELKLAWLPDLVQSVSQVGGKPVELSGEVVGTTIYVYESDEQVALATVRHEFLEAVITDEMTSVYVDAFNALKEVIEKAAYDRKEKLIDKLAEVI